MPGRFKNPFRRHKIKNKEENPVEELMEIYDTVDRDEAGTAIDSNGKQINEEESLKELIKAERIKRRRFFIFTAALTTLLTAAAFSGWWFFSRASNFEEQSLNLEISGPETAKIGQTITFDISYKNLGQVELINSRLFVQYPRGFILEKSEPQNSNHKWTLAPLKPGDQGKVLISGHIIDRPDREQKLVATLIFEPSNFNSEFSKSANFNVQLISPDIDIVSTMPATTTRGQKLVIKTKLKNNEDFPLADLKLQLIPALNYNITKSEPSAENNEWAVVGVEKSGQSAEIKIEGAFPEKMLFSTDEEREQKFTWQLFSADKDGQYQLIKESDETIKIIEQALNAYLIINGSSENKNIVLGDALAFSVVVKNIGDTDYDDIKIKTIISSQPADILNWPKISDKYLGEISKTEKGKEIVWTKKQLSSLGKLGAKKEIVIDFSIPVKQLAALPDINLNALAETQIEAHSEIEFSGGKEDINPAPVKSGAITLSLSSNADIGAKALYFFDDGTPIGSGPLPFKFGQTTKLRVFWDLSNDIHNLENISVTASLPMYVNWIDEKTASLGEISFESATKQITWKIDKLPENIKEAHANFSIAVTPPQNEIGKIIKLLGNTTLIAKDAAINSSIVKTKNILTSALEQDKFAATDGIVK